MKHFLYDNRDEASKRKFYEKLKELLPAEYVVSIKQNRAVRSLSANKYYHAILNIICLSSGQGTGDMSFDHDQLHEILKKKFNGSLIHFPKGGTEVVGNSTADLDTKEFAAYINRVKLWAKDEFEIIIPDLKDMDYKKWMDIDNAYNKTYSGW